MRRVILESPYRGKNDTETERNVRYARACVRDSLQFRGEAPIASHLLYTQEGILDDTIERDREQGIAAGLAWLPGAEAMVVYIDYGISPGMQRGIDAARACGLSIDYRRIGNR